jgi:hypothetical protein
MTGTIAAPTRHQRRKTELTPAMVNMTIESINVGKTELERLGFTIDKDVKGMPASSRNSFYPKTK